MKYLLPLILAAKLGLACTAFQLKSLDGAFIYCRSLEFGFPLNSNLLIVPRATEFTGTAPNGKAGVVWKAKFGYVGMNQSFAKNLVCDGMNEKGLVVGVLYFPGYAKYEIPDPKKTDVTLGAWELPSYLLSTCTTVAEAKAAIPNLLVAQEPMLNMGDFILPIHIYISDRTGAVLIVEYVNGKRNMYDNPLGVFTNSPAFDWHLTNLSNFVHLSPFSVPELDLAAQNLQNYGQGSGLLGLPGDYTPPSRFVRAAFFSQWATLQKTALDAVRLGFHILNTFDIFEGIVRATPSAKNSTPLSSPMERTEWVILHDRVNLRTYFRTYNSLRIQMVDLKKIDFTQSGFRQIPLQADFVVDDVTTTSQSLTN